jgi:hypothetical protein
LPGFSDVIKPALKIYCAPKSKIDRNKFDINKQSTQMKLAGYHLATDTVVGALIGLGFTSSPSLKNFYAEVVGCKYEGDSITYCVSKN